MSNKAAMMKLGRELKAMKDDPVEGVLCEVPNDSNLFEWKIWLEGSKGSAYEGGIFQLSLSFPPDYPMSPPTLKMLSEFWHPNIYTDGKVCISILHPPGEDAASGELPEERWLPTQTVSTILLSFISMINDPNIFSPANVDASVMWRDRREEYTKKAQELAKKSLQFLPPGIREQIPHPDTDPAQRDKRIQKMRLLNAPMTTLDSDSDGFEFDYDYDDDYDLGDDADEGMDHEPTSDLDVASDD